MVVPIARRSNELDAGVLLPCLTGRLCRWGGVFGKAHNNGKPCAADPPNGLSDPITRSSNEQRRGLYERVWKRDRQKGRDGFVLVE